MKFVFMSVGKAHDPALKSATEDFTARTNHYFAASWKIIPPPKSGGDSSVQKEKEGEQILASLTSDDFLVLLDERGQSLTSEKLSEQIQKFANAGRKQVVFLIGGAFGVSKSVFKRAGLVWSLSALTFPHQIVRLILAEQVYRACTILRNEKYHHR